MYKGLFLFLLATLTSMAMGFTEPPEGSNTLQSYSGKFGFYAPGDGLNNGLLLGVDVITEFVHYGFYLSGAIDVYPKKTIDIFANPQPNGTAAPTINDQQIVVLPIHVNAAYKLADIPDADTRLYAGIGGGYFFYFYSATYQSNSGGLLGGPLSGSSDSKSGGGMFGTVFARVIINKIFVEPSFCFASKQTDSMGGSTFIVNPSGFAVTLGFQYH